MREGKSSVPHPHHTPRSPSSIAAGWLRMYPATVGFVRCVVFCFRKPGPATDLLATANLASVDQSAAPDYDLAPQVGELSEGNLIADWPCQRPAPTPALSIPMR